MAISTFGLRSGQKGEKMTEGKVGKFQVGDRVIVLNGFRIEDYVCDGFLPLMYQFVGSSGVVDKREVVKAGECMRFAYHLRFDDYDLEKRNHYWFDGRGLVADRGRNE